MKKRKFKVGDITNMGEVVYMDNLNPNTRLPYFVVNYGSGRYIYDWASEKDLHLENKELLELQEQYRILGEKIKQLKNK